MTNKALLATISYHEFQVNLFLLSVHRVVQSRLRREAESHSTLPADRAPMLTFMIHRQISIKLREDLFLDLEKTAGSMRMNKHAFVVKSVEETLKMIADRGCEKVPLLVVQARAAQDYAQSAPSLPIGAPINDGEKPDQAQEPKQRKGSAIIRRKPISIRVP